MTFAGQNAGVITGEIIADNWFNLLLIAISLLLVILIFNEKLQSAIRKELYERLIEPVKSLAQSGSTTAYPNTLREVLDIESDIQNLKDKISRIERDRFAVERALSESILTSQVAHDIRSPLAALDMAMLEIEKIPEELRLLIRSAVERIHDIANNLLLVAKSSNHSTVNSSSDIKFIQSNHPELVSDLIEAIISEKRLQFRDKSKIKISFFAEPNANLAFASLNASEFQRVLSNLINNSLEALPHGGEIKLELLRAFNSTLVLKISDTGIGIPAENLKKLATYGVSFGKVSGHGIGLHHAFSTVRLMSGEMTLESTVGKGTCVTITFSECDQPEWFVRTLVISPCSKIVIVDDDPSVHLVWQNRFSKILTLEKNIELINLYSTSDFSTWMKDQRTSVSNNTNFLFLIDYEFLGQKLNGLDLIKSFNIASESVLVTSRFKDSNVRNECQTLGVGCIPKGLAALIPLHLDVENRDVIAVHFLSPPFQ